MARQKKTWVSHEYAERQARFMTLPVAKIERPLRSTVIHLYEQAKLAARRVRFDLTNSQNAENFTAMVKRQCRPIVEAAQAGNGAEVRRIARKYLLA